LGNGKVKAYIDFEFCDTGDADLTLVCCAIGYAHKDTETFWLYKDIEAQRALKQKLQSMQKDYVFFAYAAVSEARCFYTLGLDARKFKFVDVYLEYRMLLNQCREFCFGKQLIKGKEVETVYLTFDQRKSLTAEQREQANGSKAETSLAAATYKLLGEVIDLRHKDRMRDLAISRPESYTLEQQKQLLNYCASDIKNIGKIMQKIIQAYRRKLPFGCVTKSEMLFRGETAARVALIERTGYPINLGKVKNFISHVPNILHDIEEDINSQFPGMFEWSKRDGRYKRNESVWRGHIAKSDLAGVWEKTNTKLLSLSVEAFSKHFSFSHNYPRDNFFAQALRYLKLLQHFNGFKPTKDKRKSTFLDTVGKDNRSRPYIGPYGGQTARYQPKATGFVPLKAAWMRVVIEPPKGRMIVGIDYSSQEFLISALLSGDPNMYFAAKSGDPYLTFAKLAGAAPPDATKHSHEAVRGLFKSTTLGMSYGMGPVLLRKKLETDTGSPITQEQAETLHKLFKQTYSKYTQWRRDTLTQYRAQKYLKLKDGWVMFGDNDNPNSVQNFLSQGAGSCILRQAIKLAQDQGIKIIYPLHDALYAELKSGDMAGVAELAKCMRQAFVDYFTDEETKHKASIIKLDVNIWGPDCKNEKIIYEGMSVKSQTLYIDERSVEEYERFKKYLDYSPTGSVLSEKRKVCEKYPEQLNMLI